MSNCMCQWKGDTVISMCGAHEEFIRMRHNSRIDNLESQLKDKKNFLREVSSEWNTTVGDTKVTCHDRMIGGVLCRWWGDGETPEGVALIDKAVPEDKTSMEQHKTTQILFPASDGVGPVNGARRVLWLIDGLWEQKGWLMPQTGEDE